MRRHSMMLAGLLGTMLLVVPLESHAFFGFFGGGFGFGIGTGWGGWGGPGWGGWGGPGWGGWGGPGWWGPGHAWHRRWYHHYPWHWRRSFWGPHWGYPPYALPLPYAQLPQVAAPAPAVPSEPKEK